MNSDPNDFHRKLRVVDPVYWEHHRGGWGYVVRAIEAHLHNAAGVRFVSAVEDEIVYEGPLAEPWVGFVHQVPQQSLGFPDLERLVHWDAWRDSLPWCRGLWVMTEYQRRTLRELGVDAPIALVRYPTQPASHEFEFDRFRARRPRQLLMVGEFLRNYQSFYQLRAPGYEKVLLHYPGFDAEELGLETNDSVRLSRRLDASAYDRALSESLVFLDLFDAGANTTVVECIASGTPILLNRLPGPEEYLGEDYPLFYSDLREAAAMLANDELIAEAAAHLRRSPIRARLTIDQFLSDLTETGVYRALPRPNDVRRAFPRFDLTVMIFSYQRLQGLAEQLRRFAAQEFTGSFELLIWNNRYEARDKVDRIVGEAQGLPNVRVIHSSDNLFCGPRLAMPALMRSDTLMICDDDVLPEPGYLEGFWDRFHAHGGRAVICARGHTILPHKLNEDTPSDAWTWGRHLRFNDESQEELDIDFVHADNCMIGRDVLARAAAIRMEDPADVLIDDYWLSYVLATRLHVPVRKIKADSLFRFTASADDPEVALFHSPRVHDQRVSFYIRHMRHGWPENRDLRDTEAAAVRNGGVDA
jgi:glycosyltransferase involved in cell wall biosynthesis